MPLFGFSFFGLKQSIADRRNLAYIGAMRFRSKLIMLAVIPCALVLATGCGGLATSQSVSPLDFLLPGLVKADQKQQSDPSLQPVPPPKPEPAIVLARAN
jgi:hypothetical protein